MRFLVMVNASPQSEAGQLPSSDMLAKMGAFNKGLAQDGVILAADGLHPSSKGARIAFAGGKPTVTDGPFTETKELVAGFWILQGKSKDEIVARLSQAPFEYGNLEIRDPAPPRTGRRATRRGRSADEQGPFEIDANRTVEAVWRIESPKLIAGLTRMVRDIGVAEELAQDAFVAALTQWPGEGIPRNPGAWLMSIAKRRAIDRFRRAEVLERKNELLAQDATPAAGADEAALAALDEDDIGDDLLRLIFIACHPVLSMEARVALTLRLLGGLTTVEIARAFLTGEAAVAQRIVRAKRTLAEAKIPFEVPGKAERAPRLSAVLEVLYLIFNEGYAASAGDDVMRPELCEDALRLGRVLAELAPEEPEVLFGSSR